MNTRLIRQPFGSGGAVETLGAVLKEELTSPAYNQLEIWVAYATSSGTSRLYGPLTGFVNRGGVARIHVGFSNGVTSLQAIEHLLKAGATALGFETGGTVLFHPKVYYLQGRARAWVSVGSSNLTADGLYRNIEVNSLITLDLRSTEGRKARKQFVEGFENLRSLTAHLREVRPADLPSLVGSGSLVDETLAPRPQRISVRRAGSRGVPLRVPAAPPPHPDLGTVRGLPTVGPSRLVSAGTAVAAVQPRHFAMTLSSFDASHRRGRPGTPEISLPEESTAFFPVISYQGRKYADAYFDVLLNERSGNARVVSYRLWQRPPGDATGHADWRINVRHDTIDQTRPAGGDILLFERLPEGSVPLYEVWVVQPSDHEYPGLLSRCSRSVQAAGLAGVKRYGLF